MQILFFDPISPHGYTSNSLTTRPMGASESSLMRVARALAALPGYSVSVYQQADSDRTEATVQGVKHLNQHSKFTPDVIVHQRTALYIEDMRLEFPAAKHVVWLHDTVVCQDDTADGLLQADKVVCVSNWQASGVFPGADVIYNPIELDGIAPSTERVPGRLGFFSSPQKGLTQVCALFNVLKKDRPELELVVGNPGYLPDLVPPGVRFLGQLPHPAALKELSRCECLFYPQTVFAETFGCVLAEANALGVPVLAHDFGAAMEVLTGTQPNALANAVIDATDTKDVATALDSILANREAVPAADERFAIETVTKQWKQLLEGV